MCKLVERMKASSYLLILCVQIIPVARGYCSKQQWQRFRAPLISSTTSFVTEYADHLHNRDIIPTKAIPVPTYVLMPDSNILLIVQLVYYIIFDITYI